MASKRLKRKQARRAARRERRDARLDRIKARKSGKIGKIQARKAPKLERQRQRTARKQIKADAGYWSAENVASRQGTIQALGSTALEVGGSLASGGLSGLLDDFGGDEGGGSAPLESSGGGSSLPSWAIPAGVALAVVVVVVATGDKGKKK
jgi:hypothetical protein